MNTRKTPTLPPEHSAKLRKKAYKKARNPLRKELIQLQHEVLDRADFPVLVVLAGVDGAGKHESINLLNHWMDPRYLQTLAYPHDTPSSGPEMARYWRELPAKGQIGLLLSGWYSPPLLARVRGREDEEHFQHRLKRIAHFEKLLADDGALILKFWLHLDAEAQTRRLQQLASHPDTAWRVDAQQWLNVRHYDTFVEHTQTMIDATHRRCAPWHLLDGTHGRRRMLEVGQTLAAALTTRLKRRLPPSEGRDTGKHGGRLAAIDLSARLDKSEYKKRMRDARQQLGMLLRMRAQQGRSVALAFEGWDAAGKGGAIWRLVRGLDARERRVIPIAAPDVNEAARHYLWRFWRNIPEPGKLTIFDRSWYGRVLVERVEGLIDDAAWRRAFDEIRHFEDELREGDIDVMKFWLHISPEEQLARFREREANARKQHKLTEEDWRNRNRRDDYERAVEEMLARTDTAECPWVCVAANDKRHARVQIIEAINHWLRERG